MERWEEGEDQKAQVSGPLSGFHVSGRVLVSHLGFWACDLLCVVLWQELGCSFQSSSLSLPGPFFTPPPRLPITKCQCLCKSSLEGQRPAASPALPTPHWLTLQLELRRVTTSSVQPPRLCSATPPCRLWSNSLLCSGPNSRSTPSRNLAETQHRLGACPLGFLVPWT